MRHARLLPLCAPFLSVLLTRMRCLVPTRPVPSWTYACLELLTSPAPT